MLLTLLLLPFCKSVKTIPAELIGIWTTEAQEYEGVFFELDRQTIQFGKKDGSVDNFNVIKIKRKRMKGDWVRYTICYQDHKLEKCELPLVYHPHNQGIVRFVNRAQNTWSRKSS